MPQGDPRDMIPNGKVPFTKEEHCPENTAEDIRETNYELARDRAQQTKMYYDELVRQGFSKLEALQLIKVPSNYL